jgi:hypothetical protein
LIDGAVLPVVAAPRGLLLCPCFVIDENDKNGDDDRVSSMIVAVEDIDSAPSKFPAVPSADAKGRGTTTAVTAQTPCADDDNQFYSTICYDPQLTSFSTYLCPQHLEQSTKKESRGRQQCHSQPMRREDKVEADNDNAANNANRSGRGGGLPRHSHLASCIVGLLDWVRGGQGNDR